MPRQRYGSKIIWENKAKSLLGAKEFKYVRRYPTGLLEFYCGVEHPDKVELSPFSTSPDELRDILQAADWETKLEEERSQT